METRWESAFIAVSAALGEPLEVIVAELGSAAVPDEPLLRALRAPSRVDRARALASRLCDVALAIDGLGPK
jgi:hypothetical protein